MRNYPNVVRLTSRERDVLALVAQGLRNREIANQLCIQITTVENYVSIIKDKLNLDTRVHLALYYLEVTHEHVIKCLTLGATSQPEPERV